MYIGFLLLISAAVYGVMYIFPGPVSHLGGIFQGVWTLLILFHLKTHLRRASAPTNCALFTAWYFINLSLLLLLGATSAERASFFESGFKIGVMTTGGIIGGILIGIVITNQERKRLANSPPHT
jgi:hypothetical protein